MKTLIIAAIAMLGMAASAAAAEAAREVQQAVETLIDNAEKPSHGLYIGRDDPRLPAVDALRNAGSTDAVAGLLRFLTMPYGAV